jgi:beta-N-acetylhexosaminidase
MISRRSQTRARQTRRAIAVRAGCVVAAAVAVWLTAFSDDGKLSGLPVPRAASGPDLQHGAPTQTPSPMAVELAKARRVPLRRLVGEKLLVRMRGTDPSRDLLRRIRRGQIGGVVLFTNNIGTRRQARSLTARLRAAARAGGTDNGFIIAVDQEGGVVKRIRSGPPAHSAPQLGAIGSKRLASHEGVATGRYLRGLGINVDLAPVYDTVSAPGAFIQNRSFGTNPKAVGRLATAFATGLQHAHVAATAKHFPGLGGAVYDTDDSASVVAAPRSALDAEGRAFTTGIQGGIDLVMVSTAIYPAYDPAVPAAFSSKIVTGRLRKRLRFDRVVVADALDTPAVRSYTTPANGAVAAARAGVDLLIFAQDEGTSRAAYRALLQAARDGRLNRGNLETSYARIQLLKAKLGH